MCWSWFMRVPFRAVAGLDDVIAWHDELGARSLIFDVELLVALWDTDEQALRIGVETVVDRRSSGDQVATDGLLARRLGFAFAHVKYDAFPPPLGPG
jgi:hypothetical protein